MDTRVKLHHKLIALILSAAILIGLFPIGIFTSLNTAAAEEDTSLQYTLTFKNESEAIDELTGTYSVFVGDEEKIQSKELTIGSGKATIDLTEIKDDIEKAEADVTIKVKCEVKNATGNYKAKGEVVLESGTTEYEVTLTQYFTITKNVTGSGTVVVVLDGKDNEIPEGGLELAKGTKITVKATGDSKTVGETGMLKSLKIGETDQSIESPVAEYTTTEEITVDKDILIEAEFVRYVDVTFDVSVGGSVSYNDKEIKSDSEEKDKTVQVESGTKLTFTATPSENYILGSVTAGTSLTASEDGSYTFTADNYTEVKVTFTEKGKLSVTSDNGTVKITGKDDKEVADGSYVSDSIDWTIAVTPNEGYRISSVTVKQGDKEEKYEATGKEFKFSETFTNASSNYEAVTVTVEYKKIFYLDVPTDLTGGTVTVSAKDGELKSYEHNSKKYYDENTQLTLTVTAADEDGTYSHRIKSVTIGEETKQSEKYFTYSQELTVNNNTTVSVDFQKIYYISVAEDNDTNTEITFDKTMTTDGDKLFADENQSIEITAKSNDTTTYRVKDLTVNHNVNTAPAGTTDPYKITVTVTGDIVASASSQEIRKLVVDYDPALGTADLNGETITNGVERTVDVLPDGAQTVTIQAINTAVLEETTITAEGLEAETVKPSTDGTFTLNIADNKYQGKKITIEPIFKFKVTYQYDHAAGSLYYYFVSDDLAEITVNEELTASGSNKYIYVLPNKGIAVSKIETAPEIDGLSTVAPTEEDTLKGAVRIQINNISKSFQLNITFITLANADEKKYETNIDDADYYDEENDIYYFAHKEFTAKYKDTDGGKIKITDSKGNVFSGDNLTFDENTDIASLEVLYKGENEYAENWHKVADFDKKIRFDNDAPSFKAELSGQKKNDIYSGDVTVTVSGVTDPETSSGIKDITYTVEKDGKQTASGKLDVEGGSFAVSAEDNNSNDVKVKITVTDNVGNLHTEDYTISVDITAPTVNAEYTEKSGYSEDGTEYYDKDVTVKVDVTERTPNFEADKVTFKVERLDKENSKAEDYTGTLVWTHDPTEEPYTDNDLHTTELTFTEDGHYRLTVEYTDKAGNTAQSKALEFVIDRTSPDAVLSINGNEWKASPDRFGFNNFDNTAEGVKIKLDYSDSLTPIKSVEYYIDDQSKGLIDDSELSGKQFTAYDSELLIEDDSIFTVYVRVTNQLGQVNLFHSGGYIYDKTMPSDIEFTVPQGTVDNLYNGDVNINVSVSDPDKYSGISKIVYQVLSNGKVTKSETETFTEDDTFYEKYADITEHYEHTVSVDSSLNNSNDVKVRVTVTDNAGNTYTEDYSLLVDITAPTVNAEYTEKSGYSENGIEYYDKDVTVKVDVTERTPNFEADKVTFKVQRLDKENSKAEDYTGTIEWTHDPTEEPYTDNDLHTTELTFTEDGHYRLTVEYTDKAGNTAQSKALEFVIDRTSPDAVLNINGNEWSASPDRFGFNNFDNTADGVKIKLDYSDSLTPIKSVEYYIDDQSKGLIDDSELSGKQFTAYGGELLIEDDSIFTVYVRVTNQLGQVTLFHSGGYIYDKTLPNAVECAAPQGIVDNLYNGDVNINVSVSDPDKYSGISKIVYQVLSNGKVTQSETETFTEDDTFYAAYDELTEQFEHTVNVRSDLNNSNDVKVRVTVTDNAGNTYTEDYSLLVDITAPTVNAEYTEKSGYSEDGTEYYDKDVTVKVEVTERTPNFEADKVVVKVQRLDIENSAAQDYTGRLEWTHDPTEEPYTDNDLHTTELTFTEDGSYKLVAEYTDKAGNTAESQELYFVIDRTSPDAVLNINGIEWSASPDRFGFNDFDHSEEGVKIKLDYSDSLTPIKSVEYYIDDQTKGLIDDSELSEKEFSAYEDEVLIEDDSIFTVYVRVTNQLGQVNLFHSGGYIYDKTMPSDIEFTVPQGIDDELYSDDVSIDIDVNEVGKYSGINKIVYEVLKDGKVTQSETKIFTEDETFYSSYDELIEHYEFTITVDSALNNSNDVKVSVIVTDNAYNTFIKDYWLMVDVTAPTLSVTAKTDYRLYEGHKYYDDPTDVTLTVKEREENFEPDKVKVDIVKELTNSSETEEEYPITWTANPNNNNTDSDTFTCVLHFNNDARYTVTLNYTDRAGNTANSASNTLTVDKTSPTGTVSVNTSKWDELLKNLSFGLYTPTKADVKADAADITSPVAKIEYYKTSTKTALSTTTLDKQEFTEFKPFTVGKDEVFTVYIKITDAAGNYTYISSDGYIVDKTPAEIALNPAKPNENGVYNGDVKVNFSINDRSAYSGIKTAEYEVFNSGKKTQSKTLYSFDDPAPRYSLLKNTLAGSFTVDSKLNNSSNVTVKLTVIDNAGNKSEKSVKLDIDITAPEISISYNNNNDHSSGGYFDAARTATIKITERSKHFNSSKVKINISAANVKGENVADAYSISKWTDNNNSKQPDASTHTATIKFSKDANYTFSISYTDDADNKNKTPDTGDSVSPYSFTVDTVAPTAEITAKSDEGRSVTRNTLVRDLKFGFWSKSGIRITSSYDDVTSPVKSVEYYKVSAKQAEDAAKALTTADLNKITDWKTFKTIDLADNERSTVYLKVTDMAGNYTYISTDGLIVDSEAPVAETVAPEVTVTPQQPINGLYNSDVTVDISVVDPLVGGAYSGLAEITYSVYDLSQSETVPTQTGTLFEMPYGSPSQGQLTQSWDGKIVVDSELNNSNNVVVEVSATDNAGNSSNRSETLSIDITRPEIDVVYSNNSVQSGHYFSADRTATISIRERNFDPDDVKVTMTTVGGVIPTLSGWSRTAGTGNMDNTVWTATVTFNTDGDYTFGIEYTDEAGNKADAADYNGAAVPEEFTVDKTLPTVSVTYDNNSSANGNYYNDTRTATITITEHNFNAADVVISLSASDDGNVIAAPAISGWTDNGDVHTATVNYLSDALYTFDVVSIKDLAGNTFNNFEQQSFYVDLTAPSLEISGVKDSTAYNSDEIIPIITYSDTNLNEDSVSIVISSVNSGKIELNGEYADIHNGKTFTFANFEDKPEVDDIYTLTAKAVDMSGNSTEKTVVFSVNRYGSTYQITDKNTQSIIESRYVKDSADIVINEINADELTEVEITLYKSNSPITLREGEDYEMIVTGGNGEWYNYSYRIFKKNFDDNGEYSIIIHSKDKAGNLSDNDTDAKKTSVNFVVDKTPPVVNVANLENGVTYAVDSLEVNLTVSDNELALSELTIELDGAEYKKLSAEELTELLQNGGVLTFDISGNKTSAHNVKITCTDLAANASVLEIKDFYVTTDPLLLFYNTKPLFYGSIAGVVVLAGLIVFLIVWKRRKKDKKEA